MSGRPEQAVILCGGLGTRLRPITNDLPKPMAPVNGRPFLEYLVQQLKEQGMQRIVLLTGYLGETIHSHFGDGSKFGVAISYSTGPADWETGRRIWEARGMLDGTFLLMYSDNFAPFSLDKLHTLHQTLGTAVTLVAQPKIKGNMRLRDDGIVEAYDPARSDAGLDLVEIGYMIAERDRVLALIGEPDRSFSLTLQRLADERQLGAMVTRDPYHSISDLDRLKLTERYLANKRILMIDRDGTINQRPPRAEYVYSWDDFHWVDDTLNAMRELAHQGFSFIVLSNQAGIARGVLDASAVNQMNERIQADLARSGIEVLSVFVCPHHWDDGCECRKPAPGMFFQASAEHQLRMDRTIYIGDDPRDAMAAYNAGCLSVLIGSERNGAEGTVARPVRTAEHLSELVPFIIRQFEEWELVS